MRILGETLYNSLTRREWPKSALYLRLKKHKESRKFNSTEWLNVTFHETKMKREQPPCWDRE